MPLPFPEALAKGNTEENSVLSLKRGVSAVVIVLNFIALGRPRHCSEELRINRPLNKSQWEGIRRLEHLMKAWIEVSPIDAEAMGRTASKIESLEETLAGLEAAASHLAQDGRGYFVSKTSPTTFAKPGGAQRGCSLGHWTSGDVFSTFKEVDPSRLSFVGTPSFNPSPYLDELSRRIFENPLATRDDPSSYRGKKPKLKVHCSLNEKVKLFELLDSSGRLGLHRPSEVQADFGSGLFSVVKDMKKDRLILDSRGANLLERPAQRWIQSLACGESLVKLLMREGEVVRTSGNDLRDFYYLFSCSESRSVRNTLVGPLHASKVAHLNAARKKNYTDGWLFGSLRTLAMGDCQAVELAQTCHLSLALNAEVATKDNLISMHQPLPRSREMTGLVIDDFITLSLEKEDELRSRSLGAVMADKMFQKYEEVNLIPNEKKSFRDELYASFWGVDLDGKSGLLRGSLKRAIPLAGLIIRVSKLGAASAGLLEVLAGSVISIFLYRRRLLSLLDSLFESYRGREASELVGLDGRTRSDLMIIATLIPLAVTNLKARVGGRITASDASSWGEAAVTAKIPEKIAEELYRHTLRKSLWVRLLSPSAAWRRMHEMTSPGEEVPEEGTEYKSHPLWETLASCLDFELLFKKQKKGARHINVGELRGMLSAEEKLALKEPSCRQMFGMDSQVGLGAAVKGRSSSKALNAEMAQSIPVMLIQDVYSEYLYFETSRNPADDPTRGKDVRKPSGKLPPWWNSLAAGKAEAFDEWLRDLRIHPDVVGRLPQFSELLHGSLKERAVEDELLALHRKVVLAEDDEACVDGRQTAEEKGQRFEEGLGSTEAKVTDFESSNSSSSEGGEIEGAEAEATEAEAAEAGELSELEDSEAEVTEAETSEAERAEADTSEAERAETEIEEKRPKRKGQQAESAKRRKKLETRRRMTSAGKQQRS